ncbi:lysophospholipid acyltransferase family protein [Leptospira sp. GIMC2001]|uniref:lysophospholipid acyltransferase family protein n=1 Tax=Leptospira sp. GIMC2001 TaxID=1513297 RepID=UPI00234A7C18|nr:lysophospholipid acyltransferase family protein [Leptospira sp. GIMC2001]WCL48558.1 lysophospholipid acyltransferase family protein [Leptospira sp. GIMC2001]
MKPAILSFLMMLILRFWFSFIRIKEVILPDSTADLINNKKGYIFAIWHSNMASLVVYFANFILRKKKNPVSPLASHSKDGEFISLTVSRFGFKTIRGSSSKGGAAGALGLLRAAKSGVIPLITVDGPKGPVYTVKPGIVEIASLSGLPVVILMTSFDRFYEFSKSWDKHRFPKFFAKQYLVYSEPIYIPKKLNENDLILYTKKIQDKMNEIWTDLEARMIALQPQQ